MLGLSVLFFLGLWVVITIVAMVIGWKFAQKRWGIKAELLGAFLGFMLTMGGFIIYWTIEYMIVQSYVTRLCETEAGIKAYVTPEEWRKEIGEEEWEKLRPYKTDTEEQSLNFLDDITINKIKYSFFYAINHRLVVFSSKYFAENLYTSKKEYIVIDIKTNQLIIKSTYFSTGVGHWMTNGSYKFWLNNIASCSSLQSPLGKNFTNTLSQYSNQQLN